MTHYLLSLVGLFAFRHSGAMRSIEPSAKMDASKVKK